MTAALGRWRATYTPGDWVVLSGPTSLVVLEPPTQEWAPLINTLWQQVVASASIAELGARLASFKIDELPSFGAFFWTADGMRSLIRGQISVVDLATGKVVANGQGIQTWSEVGLAGVDQIRVEVPYEGDDTLLELPLVVGAVRASSVVLDASERAQVRSPQGQPAEPIAAEAPSGQTAELPADEIADQVAALQNAPTELMPSPFDEPEAGNEPDATAPQKLETAVAPNLAEDRVGTLAAHPGPESDSWPDMEQSAILAVLCPNGHVSPPNATRCRVCGRPVGSHGPQFVAHPVLAVLRASDGSTAELDRPVLIGRAPSSDRSSSHAPRLMTVPSPNHDISRTHLEVAPDDWQIVVTDLNSTNGTILVRPEAGDRQQLAPGERVPVQVGSVMELGDGVSVLIDFPQ
jgi:FHA domain